MTEWKMNNSSLERGMIIRRPGLDEALEVVNVRNGQAKIKLPDGKTSTIPASAEVEWSWPSNESTKTSSPSTVRALIQEMAADIEAEDSWHWQTDWSLLDVGSKISVLGESGDFTILRLTDSSARIKHNATGQIMPLSIGHKFKVIDSDTSKEGKAVKEKGKAKGGKKPAQKTPELPPQEPDIELEPENEIANDEPSDEILAKIENGDEVEDDDLGASPSDDDTDLDTDNDLDDETETEANTDTNLEDDDMPAPSKPSRAASTSLLTLGQIAERTGISYPTLVRYVRDHGDRLLSEGEGRSRRYYPAAIETFNEIRLSTKGGRKPGAGKPANPRKAKPAPMPNRSTRTERSHETAAPYAAPAKSKGNVQSSAAPTGTIDQALASAIDHARAQMNGLQALVENLEAQRESLKLWS